MKQIATASSLKELESISAKTSLQQPEYPCLSHLESVSSQLALRPPLVFAREVDQLQNKLATASLGEGFVFQGGSCAETFNDYNEDQIKASLQVILQASLLLTYALGKPIVKIGRLAGQFAKPRSSNYEIVNGLELGSYRGDIVNSSEVTKDARIPDPNRMLRAYDQAAGTLNLVRAFCSGGLGDLNDLTWLTQNFAESTRILERFKDLAQHVTCAVQFIKAIGLSSDQHHTMKEVDFFVSHEALLLPYEIPLVRRDSFSGDLYLCSTHFPWIGERTRQLDGAHVELLSMVANPLGVKISEKIHDDEILRLLDKLNPKNLPGRVSLITRMGHESLARRLPQLIRLVQSEGKQVCWLTDPMHANTTILPNGKKTRFLELIFKEMNVFFDVHKAEASVGSGIHLEMTGEPVTECVGAGSVFEGDLNRRYETACDPRLNGEQVLTLTFELVDKLITDKSGQV